MLRNTGFKLGTVLVLLFINDVTSFTPSMFLSQTSTTNAAAIRSSCSSSTSSQLFDSSSSFSSSTILDPNNNNKKNNDRRQFMKTIGGLVLVGESSNALFVGQDEQNIAWAAGTGSSIGSKVAMEIINDSQHNFSIEIPKSWKKDIQKLNDRREIVFYTDPNNEKIALFIAYTPVRDDFTSLGSFGSVEQVAQQTILPKTILASSSDKESDVSATLIKAINLDTNKNTRLASYLFEYTQQITSIQQPLTRFVTLFTLVPGATGGAGSVLVTITLQTPEEYYTTQQQDLFTSIINSCKKAIV